MVKKFVQTVFVLCMVVPLIIFAARIYDYRVEDQKIEDVKRLVNDAVMAIDPAELEIRVTDVEGTPVKPEGYMEAKDMIDFERLREENPHVNGVIRIDGTRIDYPVMRTDELEYYINRDFYGNESTYGSIFVDGVSQDEWPNTLVYGHNMRNGAMFGELDRYSEKSYRDAHPVIKYIAEDKILFYTVAAAFSVDVKEDRMIESLPLFGDREAKELTELILSQGGTIYEPVEAEEEYLSLITCEYTHSDGRYIVIGKKIGEIEG